MADDKPTTDDIFGAPGSALHDAWMDYFMAWDPQERLKAHIRLMSVQYLTKELSNPRRFVEISGI